MPQTFRPYPEPGADNKGTFNVTKFLVGSISNGPLHFIPLVVHILIPVYCIYRVLRQTGYWNAQVEYAIEAILVPLLQGVSLGGFLGCSFLRFGTPEGRKVASKRADEVATAEEDSDQHQLDIMLWGFVYLAFATLLWQRLPVADGPGIAAFKRLAGKVGIDLGGLWNTRWD